MKKDEFKDWLQQIKFPDSKTTVNNRISNCKNVEKYYGDLDTHFIQDRCSSIINELNYSTEDSREKRPQKHKVSIDGNIVTGSATLKSTIKLYVEFRDFIIEYSNSDLSFPKEVIYDQSSDGGIIIKELRELLMVFKYDKNKHIDITVLQNEVKAYLKEKLNKFLWETEYKPSKAFKDSIDIFGSSTDNKFKIVIELDAHRADQVAKKFLSRSALFNNENIVYISLCYPGTVRMSKSECIKYFDYCSIISKSLSGNSNNSILYSGLILK